MAYAGIGGTVKLGKAKKMDSSQQVPPVKKKPVTNNNQHNIDKKDNN